MYLCVYAYTNTHTYTHTLTRICTYIHIVSHACVQNDSNQACTRAGGIADDASSREIFSAAPRYLGACMYACIVYVCMYTLTPVHASLIQISQALLSHF
jgi:hypothetical protein